MSAAVNTHDQLRKAGGGIAITIARGGARSDYVSGWYVYRIGADGKEIPTTSNGAWYDYGRKWFSIYGAAGNGFQEKRRSSLEEAKKWVAEQGWYDGEWVGNRDRWLRAKGHQQAIPNQEK